MLHCSRCIVFPLSYTNKCKIHKGSDFCLFCSLLYLQGQGQCLDIDGSQFVEWKNKYNEDSDLKYMKMSLHMSSYDILA